MSFTDLFIQLETEKKSLQEKFDNIKPEYRAYITNKNIPLLVRWDVYIKAPSEVKRKLDYIFDPRTKFLKHVKENWFDASEVYGRGRHIYIAALFQDLVGDEEICMENMRSNKFTKKDIEDSLEELLTMNLDYFTYDW